MGRDFLQPLLAAFKVFSTFDESGESIIIL
jgi:hypothetical protein